MYGRTRILQATLVVLVQWLAATAVAFAAGSPAPDLDYTPPRLSYIDGDVSFWRDGAEDWTPARVNTALSTGDELFADEDASFELQTGPRSYARGGEGTQLGLSALEPGFLQMRVTSGQLSMDLRADGAAVTFEIDTPGGAITIEHAGYYRVEVYDERTLVTSRRGGRATLSPARGNSVAISSNEQVVVAHSESPTIESYAAPELDAWDRWNYARTDAQLEAVSARYVPDGVYGVDDLDHHGDWRLIAPYGAVWIPRGLPTSWAPYSSGRWMYDAYFGWTWVDDEPWGWAPFHYGRWVHVSGFWAWCPGPVGVAVYAPALVAFYDSGGLSIGLTLRSPRIAWVALAWGEPLIPWWGPAAFRGRPTWRGWWGPHLVNERRVLKSVSVDAKEIRLHQNAKVRDALIAAERDRFGRRSARSVAFGRPKPGKLELIRGDIRIEPDRTSWIAERGPTPRPPERVRSRIVVAAREPRSRPLPPVGGSAARTPPAPRPRAGAPDTAPRRPTSASPPPRPRMAEHPPKRPPAGDASIRQPAYGRAGQAERSVPPAAPRFERSHEGRGAPAPVRPEPVRPEPARPDATRPSTSPPSAGPAPRSSTGHDADRGRGASSPRPPLPGEPANRVYPNRSNRSNRETRPSAPEPQRPTRTQPRADPEPSGSGRQGRSVQPGSPSSRRDRRGSRDR